MWKQKDTFSSYMQEFPVRDTELVQLGTGALGLKANQVWGTDLLVSKVECLPLTVWRMFAHPEWVGLLLPLRWRGEYKLNGWKAEPGDVFFLDGKSEFTTISAQRSAMLISMRRNRLEKACADLLGKNEYTLGDGHALLNTNSVAVNELNQTVEELYSASAEVGTTNGKLYLLKAFEVDAFDKIASWLLFTVSENFEAKLSNPKAYEISTRALEFARQLPAEQVSLSELCKGAGVGKSTLHNAFLETHGMSPMQLVLKQRLTAVRELLAAPLTPTATVKDAALRSGFSSFGRFSKQYFYQFGELPSQTLERSKSQILLGG